MNNEKKYKVISLFCGCGGIDMGLLLAGGFDIVLANDFNQEACDTYKYNIGNHVVCDDIKNLHNIPKVDLIVGGPPCQGFSTANPNRVFDDPRNFLFKEYARIISEAEPKVFLMENVRGILTLDKGRVFKAIKAEFEELGYHLYEKVLNAVNFGVPQIRNRVILIGVKKEITAEFKYPTPLTTRHLTVGDTILNRTFHPDDVNHTFSNLTPTNLERLKYIPQGGSLKDCPDYLWNNSDLKRSMRRLDASKPSYTIVHNNCDHYYHPTEDRRITIKEMALLQSYPQNYVFMGSKAEQSRQVGNSVPVNLAYHIALSIKDLLDQTNN